MGKFEIEGGIPLKGTVQIGGSKNAALPIICASLLTKEKVTLENVPDIEDVHSMIEILKSLGSKISFSKNTLTIESKTLRKSTSLPKNLIKKMRASILI